MGRHTDGRRLGLGNFGCVLLLAVPMLFSIGAIAWRTCGEVADYESSKP
jgi:hypothetical protein